MEAAELDDADEFGASVALNRLSMFAMVIH